MIGIKCKPYISELWAWPIHSIKEYKATGQGRNSLLFIFLIFNNIMMIGKAVRPIVNSPWKGLYMEQWVIYYKATKAGKTFLAFFFFNL